MDRKDKALIVSGIVIVSLAGLVAAYRSDVKKLYEIHKQNSSWYRIMLKYAEFSLPYLPDDVEWPIDLAVDLAFHKIVYPKEK